MHARNREDLIDWMRSKNIDTSQWGHGAAKTVDSLWSEIARGETTIQDDPPLRLLSVAQVLVVRDGAVLVETQQLLSDGRTRMRNRVPSEKMLKGESYRAAAIRCLVEELGVSPEQVNVIGSSYRRLEKDMLSPSYPGLKSKYVLHTIDATVDGLPQRDFWTAETEHGGGPTVDRHYWSWKPYSEEVVS